MSTILLDFLAEEIKYSSKVPCILHMDSLKGSHTGLENVFQSYLCEEWKGRHKSMVDDVCSRLLHLQFISPKLPQQENFYDCGLFLLHYVELFLMNAPISFSLFQTMKFSDFETEEAAVSLLDSRTINFLEPEEGRLSRVLNLVSTQPHEDWLLEKVGASNLRDENINLEEDNSVSKEENAYESDDEECAKRRKLVHSGGERLFTMDLFK